MTHTNTQKHRLAKPHKTGLTLLAAAVAAAMLLAASPAWSQSSATTTPATPGTGSTGAMGATGNSGTGSSSTGAGSTAGSAGTASGGALTLARADSSMMMDLAQANLAEIETGKLALEKAQSDDTKKFAQQMIDDHTAALDQLKTIATTKGVTLPTEPGLLHKTELTALKALSGKAFDNQYRSHAGVGDHERTLKLLQKIQKDAKDPELKSMATTLQPKVQEHLKMAQQLNNKKL
jgi:putative membrane protein